MNVYFKHLLRRWTQNDVLFQAHIMVYKYKRKSQQQTWDSTSMQRAIEAVKNEGMAFQTAAKQFNVPRNTLKRRVKDTNVDAKGNKKVLGKYRPVFNEEQENDLVQHLLDLEVRFFGVTSSDLRSLAYQLAVKNNIPHHFNNESKMAGKDWVTGFKERHPELTLRKPEKTSAARAQAFNRPNVMKFFNILGDVQEKHLHPPHRVYNVDETGLLTVQSKSSKVFALRGRRQVGSLTSAERGVLSTFAVCMSAGGNYIPPFVIFPRQRMKVELTNGAPPGTKFACHTSGWMQSDIFIQWFDHFLKHAKPTADDPVLLILDGHATHTKNLEFIEKARENYTTVVCLPPHCSHKMQPLDVSFMGPFNTFYVQSIERFLRNNPGRVVTQFQVSQLLGEAFLKAATPVTAINGFKKCGIVPFNPEVFSEADFVAAEYTDVAIHEDDLPDQVERPSQTEQEVCATLQRQANFEQVQEQEDLDQHQADLRDPTPTPENKTCRPISNPFDNPQPGTSFAVSPKELLPLPKAKAVKRTHRKKGTAAVLTASPYKNDLVNIKLQKEQDEKERARKRKLREESKKVADKMSSDKNNENKVIKKKKKCVNARTQLFHEQSDSDVSDTDCLYCGEYFSSSKDAEGWIKCSGCNLWAHEACAGCEEEDDYFICEHCKEK